MFSLFNRINKTQQIRCPQCFEEQEVSVTTISAYCKNCRERIDIKKIKQSQQSRQQDTRWKPRTKTISCPICHSLQEVLSNAISAYCKSCHQRIPVQETKGTEFREAPSLTEKREITCPHCGNPQSVPTTALSSCCSECGNRINLQNYQIRGRFHGELETKGNIFIASDGVVEGNINTGSLIVAGGFKGEVIAEGKIELKSTARLFGKLRAPSIVVSSGAVFVGHSHIGSSEKKKKLESPEVAAS